MAFVSMLGAFLLAGTYNMQDLEVLKNQKNFKEYLRHAHDVLPRFRQGPWVDMTRDVAVMRVKQLMGENSSKAIARQEVLALSEWPTLKEDPYFQVTRNEFLLNQINNCELSEKTECLELAEKIWSSSAKNVDLAAQLLAITWKWKDEFKPDSPLEYVMQDPLAESFCPKEAVKNWILFFLEKKVSTMSRPIQEGWINHSLTNDCLKPLSQPLWDSFFKGSSSYRSLLGTLFETKKLGTPTQRDALKLAHLLLNPEKGDYFNLSWNFLESIGEKYQDRQKILELLKDLDPLPGAIFATDDDLKVKVITRSFSRNFPEYLRVYAQKCLAYHQGLGEFPNGNPTVECRELMNIAPTYSLLPTPLIKKYESILSKTMNPN